MHSAVLLADENKRLRAANKRQTKKRAVRRSYIAKGGALTVQEGLNRSAIVNIELTGQSTGRLKSNGSAHHGHIVCVNRLNTRLVRVHLILILISLV
jgi:hypothetical protein